MSVKTPPLGILQGRLTPSPDGSIQFFPKDNWEKEFVIAKQLGFDCMEWLIKKESYEENPLRRPYRNYLKDTLEIPILSVHGFYDKNPHYSSILGNIIEYSSAIGARTVLISFFKDNALKSESDKKLALKQILPALQVYKNTSVRLGIETEMPARELLEFVGSFDHSDVGVYYDIGNMASIGVDVVEEIKFLGNLICGVHVKDRLANGGKTVPLGEGCADFEGAFRALCQVGYKGPFIIQGARVAGMDDIDLNREYFHFCKDLLQKTYGGGGR